MPITLDALKTAINPRRTALVLGAGASVPSGAPTGAQLAARLWRKVANAEAQSDDFVETTSILVRRYSRRAVVDEVVATLQPLQPTGGILGLPQFNWNRLFTTNFDRLMETAYKKNNIQIAVMRSNFDFSTKETASGVRLYKMHGCITQDESLGHKESMILTETDYDAHQKYRQVMFSLLQSALMEGDVLVLGHSLRDRHLHELIKQVLESKQEGAPGHVYNLVYNQDDLRAPLLEDRGARIAFGGIDEFVHVMAQGFTEATVITPENTELPLSIISTVRDAMIEARHAPNVKRMFNGGPATYADIESGATFERSRQVDVVGRLAGDSPPTITIIGAAGVGKTTFARQILLKLNDIGVQAWEHRNDFTFQYEPWLGVEAQLRASGKKGALCVDECTHYLRATNTLVDRLSAIPNSALRVVLTANSAQWAPRMKSPNIFGKGLVVELSRLVDSELNSLLNLVERNQDIASLVYRDFRRLPRGQQFQALRQKSSSDMFVCLKNIFANESLDTILLQEFSELEAGLQDYYRYVAALEAVGTRVHRQLIIRMLGMNPTAVSAVLTGLSGIIDEYDIDRKYGIYGWSTRHIVIARRITEYKFSSLYDLKSLFESIVESIKSG